MPARVRLKELSDATARIGDVVRLINDIAGQTNLLALNATIGAARAGEAGKGFAVVAAEVKTLATQTANATSEIGGQIDAVRSATEASVSVMADVAGIIGRLDEVAVAIASAVEEQSATTREIASNVQQVSASGQQATDAMKNVVGVSDEANAASQQVLTAATGIREEAARLRAEVDQFLAALRDETGSRRRYERIPGDGATATLHAGGREPVSAVVLDISRGGIALVCDWQLAPARKSRWNCPGRAGQSTPVSCAGTVRRWGWCSGRTPGAWSVSIGSWSRSKRRCRWPDRIRLVGSAGLLRVRLEQAFLSIPI